mmetsp:Transcript_117900/g.320009  ORF Transcript_117900/g.320009 Transcript_117900/m.320009 type:complete len:269 (+) Transcript_117900:866-1672(+)
MTPRLPRAPRIPMTLRVPRAAKALRLQRARRPAPRLPAHPLAPRWPIPRGTTRRLAARARPPCRRRGRRGEWSCARRSASSHKGGRSGSRRTRTSTTSTGSWIRTCPGTGSSIRRRSRTAGTTATRPTTTRAQRTTRARTARTRTGCRSPSARTARRRAPRGPASTGPARRRTRAAGWGVSATTSPPRRCPRPVEAPCLLAPRRHWTSQSSTQRRRRTCLPTCCASTRSTSAGSGWRGICGRPNSMTTATRTTPRASSESSATCPPGR